MGQSTISSWLKSSSKKSEAVAASLSSNTEPVINDVPDGKHDTRAHPPVTFQETKTAATTTPLGAASLKDSRASIETCSQRHLKAFRRLTALLLPIPYPDSFFQETINDPTIASLTKVVWWTDAGKRLPATGGAMEQAATGQLVAGIRCRLLAAPPNDPSQKMTILYISTLGTLSPFRGHGLATQLLREVTQIAARTYGATAVMGHVWEANEEALGWYKKRGFRVVDRDEMYYRRLAPKTAAFVIKRDILPSDLVEWAASEGAG